MLAVANTCCCWFAVGSCWFAVGSCCIYWCSLCVGCRILEEPALSFDMWESYQRNGLKKTANSYEYVPKFLRKEFFETRILRPTSRPNKLQFKTPQFWLDDHPKPKIPGLSLLLHWQIFQKLLKGGEGGDIERITNQEMRNITCLSMVAFLTTDNSRCKPIFYWALKEDCQRSGTWPTGFYMIPSVWCRLEKLRYDSHKSILGLNVSHQRGFPSQHRLKWVLLSSFCISFRGMMKNGLLKTVFIFMRRKTTTWASWFYLPTFTFWMKRYLFLEEYPPSWKMACVSSNKSRY